jgi:flavin reductase (DIM6/NTAB) family NADH-FMN oxidoreductase RutF
MSTSGRAGHLRTVQPPGDGLPRSTPPTGDQRALRDVLGRFATGITVLTSAGEVAHGMTANSFSSVSLDPPLVLVCVSRGALMHQTIAANRTFAVSVLGADQEYIARYFANSERPAGLAQFDSVDWDPGPSTGAPLLANALAWLECELSEVYDGGDHSIFLGRVLGLGNGAEHRALLFYGGTYHQVLPSSPAVQRPTVNHLETS